MESDWKKRTASDPKRTAKLAIAKDAANSGCLVYSIESGKWYTPKQFMEANNENVYIHRGKDDGEKKFRIMKPEAGIKQKLAALQAAEQDLQQFMAMVSEYYELQAKKRLGK